MWLEFISFFAVCYLIGFFLVKFFIKKDKWQWFFIFGWGVALLGFVINVFLHHNTEDFTNHNELKTNMIFAIYETLLEPVHHILFVISVVWLVVKKFRK